MLSSTASPLKRRSVAIPESMQRMIAKLQFSRKSQKSMKNPLSMQIKTYRKKKINSLEKYAIAPLNIDDSSIIDSSEKDDLIAPLNTDNSSTIASSPTQNDESSKKLVPESPLMDYNTFKKKRNSMYGTACNESVENMSDSIMLVPASASSNNDLSSKIPLDSFGNGDEIFECTRRRRVEVFVTGRKDEMFPQTIFLDQCDSTVSIQKITTCDKFFGNENASEIIQPSIAAPVRDEHKFDIKKNTSISTVSTTRKNGDSCTDDFITFDNILQYTGKGSFADEVLGDDTDVDMDEVDQEKSEYNPQPQEKSVYDSGLQERSVYNLELQEKSAYIPGLLKKSTCNLELQDKSVCNRKEKSVYNPTLQEKGVQVPSPEFYQGQEPLSPNDICRELQEMIIRARGINDMITEANERILKSMKLPCTADDGKVL